MKIFVENFWVQNQLNFTREELKKKLPDEWQKVIQNKSKYIIDWN